MGAKLRRREAITGYALLAPSLFGVVAFLVLPIFVVLWLAFQDWDLLAPLEFVGLANFTSVLTDAQFGRSLLVTGALLGADVRLVGPGPLAPPRTSWPSSPASRLRRSCSRARRG